MLTNAQTKVITAQKTPIVRTAMGRTIVPVFLDLSETCLHESVSDHGIENVLFVLFHFLPDLGGYLYSVPAVSRNRQVLQSCGADIRDFCN